MQDLQKNILREGKAPKKQWAWCVEEEQEGQACWNELNKERMEEDMDGQVAWNQIMV